MSADLLRRAAAQMRERATAATGPEWAEWHLTDDGRAEVFVPNGTMDTETVFEFKDHMDCEECVRPNEADLLHITTFASPAVALAVADWLDSIAESWEELTERFRPGGMGTWSVPEHHPALAVARAYLGETA